MEKPAIHGGKKTIDYPIPSWGDISGRSIGEEEKKAVLEVLDSGHLGMVGGKKVAELQEKWAEKFGVSTAVAVNSGTSALHAALVFLGIGPGDEVLVPCATDMGTVIAVLLQNAVPVFVDVDILTQNMLPEDLERKLTPRSKAVIPVHMFGYPAPMDEIMAISRAHGLIVVEDCCQAHMTLYKGRPAGTIGDVGCFSFQQTKHVTAGEGGMVITNEDMRFGRKLQLCGDKGWPREKYREHYFLAPNYHMTELQAAVAICQLAKLDDMIEARRASAHALTEVLRGCEGVSVPPDDDGNRHTYFDYEFFIAPARFTASRDELVEAIRAEGVPGLLPSYLPKPLYEYDFLVNSRYYKNEGGCPVACPLYGGEADYTGVRCLNMLEGCARGIFLGWNEKMTPAIAADIGRAIGKVLAYYAKGNGDFIQGHAAGTGARSRRRRNDGLPPVGRRRLLGGGYPRGEG